MPTDLVAAVMVVTPCMTVSHQPIVKWKWVRGDDMGFVLVRREEVAIKDAVVTRL